MGFIETPEMVIFKRLSNPELSYEELSQMIKTTENGLFLKVLALVDGQGKNVLHHAASMGNLELFNYRAISKLI